MSHASLYFGGSSFRKRSSMSLYFDGGKIAITVLWKSVLLFTFIVTVLELGLLAGKT